MKVKNLFSGKIEKAPEKSRGPQANSSNECETVWWKPQS